MLIMAKFKNIVAKGEIAHFPFCHNCFQKLSAAEALENYMWERVFLLKIMLFPKMNMSKKPLER